MRLWSLHPCYLDTKGLLAVWREGLLAQKVLQGKTKGYQQHPQLARFKEQSDPIASIGGYLKEIITESRRRGYSFNEDKIVSARSRLPLIKVSRKQLLFEFAHLKHKLKLRDTAKYKELLGVKKIRPHALFKVTAGDIAPWEKI